MSLKYRLLFLLFTIPSLIFAQIQYATNFSPSLRWGPRIVYGCVADDLDRFRTFIHESINNFTHVFGNYITFEEELDYQRLINYDRYEIFSETDEDCGDCAASYLGPSTVFMNIDKEFCGQSEVFALILCVLGFVPTIKRVDRDEHLRFNWDNIDSEMTGLLQIKKSLANSTNPAFKVYDFSSILHLPAYSDYAIDPSKPIYEPLDKRLMKIAAVRRKDRPVSPNDVEIFKAIYGEQASVCVNLA